MTAFEQLTQELIDAKAPGQLINAARASALEEINHARVTTHLAKRFGAAPRAPSIADRANRSAYELALDNASEGCVRETFGALLAHHQALHAQDAEIREAMVTIAEDETRHAELSWAIDGWVRAQLTPNQCAAVDAARAESLTALKRSLEKEALDPAVSAQAGMPTREVSRAMLSVLETGLFS